MKKIMFAALLVLSVQAFAQKVSNKLSFQKGQQLEMNVEMSKSSTQSLMGQTMESSVTGNNLIIFLVKDASESASTIESKTKKVKLNISMMGRKESFDSENPNDLKEDMGKVLGSIIDKTSTLSLDATGLVTAYKVVDNKKLQTDNDKVKVTPINDDEPSKEEDPSEMLAMILGGANPSFSTPKVGDPSIFKILPNKEVAKGDSWTEESSDDKGKRKAVFTITDVTDKDVLISFTEETSLDTKQEIMGMEAGISMKGNTKGTIIVDKATGILKEKKSETTSEENISAAGQSMPSTSKMTSTITVRQI